MEKEKLINWRNVHSPLLFHIARHVQVSSRYWDISVKEMGEEATAKERAMMVVKEKKLKECDYLFVNLKHEVDFKRWGNLIREDKWNFSLRADGFGLLVYMENTERKNPVLGGRLRFFNSKNSF